MQVKELQNRVKTYMREESKDDWLQPADPYIIAMDVRVRCSQSTVHLCFAATQQAAQGVGCVRVSCDGDPFSPRTAS